MAWMRIIAGPNGPGKSFLTKWLRQLNKLQFGVTLGNLIPATAMTYRAYMSDNSGLGHELVCEVFGGQKNKAQRRLPAGLV